MAKAKEATDINTQLEQELDKLDLGDMVRAIDDAPDKDIEVTSTGLVRLDRILHPEKMGLAHGRDVEINSDEPEVGKTSLALQIGATWQKNIKRVAIADIADTITNPHLRMLGWSLSREESPNLYMPYWINTTADGGGPKPAEEILDSIRALINVMDLIIVDDLPCLIKAADLEKDADEATQTGGIGKNMTEHMRRTTHKRATIIWINQRRERIGRTMHGIPPKKKSMGGEALPFWASIRINLAMIKKIEIGSDDNKEVVGMHIKAETIKNKTAPPFKKTILNYYDSEGFSNVKDYMDMAVKLDVIEKSGAYYSFNGERIGASEHKSYLLLRENPHLFQLVKEAVDAVIRTK